MLSLLRLLPDSGRISGGRVLFDGEDLLALTPAEFRQRRHQQHVGDTVSGVELDRLPRSLGGLLIAAAVEMTQRERVESRPGPRIERAQPHSTLAPFDRPLGFSGPSEHDAANVIRDGRRRADRECRLECRKGGVVVVPIHADGESGEGQSERVVLAMQDGSLGMVDRSRPAFFTQTCAQEEAMMAHRRKSVRQRVSGIERERAFEKDERSRHLRRHPGKDIRL